LSKKLKSQLEMQGEVCSFGSKVNDNFTAPSLITGQKVVKFQASIDFTCVCKICEMQMAKVNLENATAASKQWGLYSNPKESTSYYKLIEQLISPSHEIESCACLITDTIFINDEGKPNLYAKTDRDGKVSAHHNKLGIQDIRMKIMDDEEEA